jgi:hypothetical protein
VTDPVRDAVLNLSPLASEYVRLPSGAGAAQTISGWMKWGGGNSWQRIFDFGQNENSFFYFTAADSTGFPQCAITPDLSVYNQVIESPIALPTNQWVPFAVVMDGKEGILYLNGAAVAVNNSINLLPSDLAATNIYLGRSEFSTDPYFNGRLSSMRLNSDALSFAQLVAPLLEPGISVSFGGAGLVNLTWPQWASPLTLYSTTNLAPPVSWSPVGGAVVSSNGWLNLSVRLTNGSYFYRLQWQ